MLLISCKCSLCHWLSWLWHVTCKDLLFLHAVVERNLSAFSQCNGSLAEAALGGWWCLISSKLVSYNTPITAEHMLKYDFKMHYSVVWLIIFCCYKCAVSWLCLFSTLRVSPDLGRAVIPRVSGLLNSKSQLLTLHSDSEIGSPGHTWWGTS